MSAVYLTPEQVLAIDEWLSQIEKSTDILSDVLITQTERNRRTVALVSYGPVFASFLPDGTMIPEEV